MHPCNIPTYTDTYPHISQSYFLPYIHTFIHTSIHTYVRRCMHTRTHTHTATNNKDRKNEQASSQSNKPKQPYKQTNERTNEATNQQANTQTNKRANERTSEQTSEQTHAHTNKLTNTRANAPQGPSSVKPRPESGPSNIQTTAGQGVRGINSCPELLANIRLYGDRRKPEAKPPQAVNPTSPKRSKGRKLQKQTPKLWTQDSLKCRHPMQRATLTLTQGSENSAWGAERPCP